jgi:hypothetical protein
MNDSKRIAVEAGVIMIFGLVLIGVSQTITIPSAYNTFFGIPISVNPEFQSSFEEMLALFVFGFLFIGFGIGMFGTIGYVLRLERKMSQIPPSPQAFCRYCGAQNAPDAVFCSKCGKKLT